MTNLHSNGTNSGSEDDWEEKIKRSSHFVAIIDLEYMKNPLALYHVEYAKKLQKPFRVLLLNEAVLPENFFEGVDDLLVLKADSLNKESLDKFRRLLVETTLGVDHPFTYSVSS